METLYSAELDANRSAYFFSEGSSSGLDEAERSFLCSAIRARAPSYPKTEEDLRVDPLR